jgi:mRNA interferase MazF
MPDDAQDKPPRVQPRIRSAPKIRQIYRCDFWQDAILPEMWKTRPVIVLSHKTTLYGPCLVVPMSTSKDNEREEWSCPLPPIQGFEKFGASWAICNQPATVSVSRLRQVNVGIVTLPQEHFNKVHALVLKWIPPLRQAPEKP